MSPQTIIYLDLLNFIVWGGIGVLGTSCYQLKGEETKRGTQGLLEKRTDTEQLAVSSM